MKEIIVSAKIENLPLIMEFVENELDANEFAGKAKLDVCIAVDEVFNNIASYAYEGENGSVTVRVNVEHREVTVEFEDDGVPFNPLVVDNSPLGKNAEDSAIGGLGILMFKQLTDYVTYKRMNYKNVLTLKKRGT